MWGIHRSPVHSPHKGQWRHASAIFALKLWEVIWFGAKLQCGQPSVIYSYCTPVIYMSYHIKMLYTMHSLELAEHFHLQCKKLSMRYMLFILTIKFNISQVVSYSWQDQLWKSLEYNQYLMRWISLSSCLSEIWSGCGMNAFCMMTSSNGNIFRITGHLCVGNSPITGEFPHKGQWHWPLMFTLICVWINGWVNNRDTGDLRYHCAHYVVTVMECHFYLGVGSLMEISFGKQSK